MFKQTPCCGGPSLTVSRDSPYRFRGHRLTPRRRQTADIEDRGFICFLAELKHKNETPKGESWLFQFDSMCDDDGVLWKLGKYQTYDAAITGSEPAKLVLLSQDK
ncbi:hypothetical protein NQZ68_030872 [Dissostichus eleginoides]|nr:hypothetical protein NQZ68_030872 [Dissostichus eleginoides]